MTKAINAQTLVSYIEESTENVTPATPTFKVARATGESLAIERNLKFSSELNGFRGEKNAAVAVASGSGGLNFEWTAVTLEDFLQATLRSTWASNVITDQAVQRSFTVETKFEDGTTDVYKRLTGAQFDSLTLDLKAGEVLKGSVSLMSRGADFATSAVAGATYSAANTENINVGANVTALAFAGLTVDCVPALTFAVKNNLRNQLGLGSITPLGIGAGKAEVTGTVSMLLDSTEYNFLRAYADGTPTGLTFTLGQAANKNTRFEVPNCYIEGLKVESTSVDGDVIATANWRGLQATSLSNSVIRVTRGL